MYIWYEKRKKVNTKREVFGGGIYFFAIFWKVYKIVSAKLFMFFLFSFDLRVFWSNYPLFTPFLNQRKST